MRGKWLAWLAAIFAATILGQSTAHALSYWFPGCSNTLSSRFAEEPDETDQVFKPVIALLTTNLIVNDAPYETIVYENGLVFRTRPPEWEYRTFVGCMQPSALSTLRKELDEPSLAAAPAHTTCTAISHANTQSVLVRTSKGWLATSVVGSVDTDCAPAPLRKAWATVATLPVQEETEITSHQQFKRVAADLSCIRTQRELPPHQYNEYLETSDFFRTEASAPAISELEDVVRRLEEDLLIVRVTTTNNTANESPGEQCSFKLSRQAWNKLSQPIFLVRNHMQPVKSAADLESDRIWLSVTSAPDAAPKCRTSLVIDTTGVVVDQYKAINGEISFNAFQLCRESLEDVRSITAALKASHSCEDSNLSR